MALPAHPDPEDPGTPPAAPAPAAHPGGDDEAFSTRKKRRLPKHPPRRRLSEILNEVAADESRSRISVADLLQVMSGRAIGALLLLFSLPNILPAPPGTSIILGLPLVYLSAQMMLGRLPWLPAFIADRSLSRADFAATITRATPTLARAEKLLKPRLSVVVRGPAERALGALCLLLAVILLLPIPLGNILPAIALALIALGVLERDGAWVLGGVAFAATSLFVIAGVVYGLVKAAIYLVLQAF